MDTVRQLLQDKGSKVWSIGPQASVYVALQMMAEKNVGALLIVGQGKLAGIFTERDYARKMMLKEKSSKDIPVSELMTEKVFCISLDMTVEDCMEQMTERHIRHLPVLENNRVIGIVTIRDVIKKIISKQDSAIRRLEDFIAREYGENPSGSGA